MSTEDERLAAARAIWRWRGADRPPFAVAPGDGQESVWDYPRPPAIVADAREIVIVWRGREIASTRDAVRVLETAHPPTFYLPREAIDPRVLARCPGTSRCEWKGPAEYWSLVDGDARLDRVAWSYPRPYPSAAILTDRFAFYAHALDCTVGGERVVPQRGGFYGGWITPELVGPFKGDPGTHGL